MSREDLLSFQAAVTGWVYQVYKASWDHKSAIDSRDQIDEIEQYDVGSGWPENRLS